MFEEKRGEDRKGWNNTGSKENKVRILLEPEERSNGQRTGKVKTGQLTLFWPVTKLYGSTFLLQAAVKS